MSLRAYHAKRKFSATPEPRGRTARRNGSRFVIQKHAARRLHYDLRLELDGVMKSWAVTRGPSLVPGEKRLAVRVEDHPIEYNTFEGTIPQGQYGGGTVLIWDRGTWTPDGDAERGLEQGRLDFTLDGDKLHGAWHLVRMRARPGEKRENWLLIKARDDAARGARDPDILEAEPDSVATGRSIDEIAAARRGRVWQSSRGANGQAARAAKAKTARGAKGARAKKETQPEQTRRRNDPDGGQRLPDFIAPSLATLSAQAPSGVGWVHEIKFDGYRIEARLDHGKVRLLTRKGLDWTEKFPNIAQAVTKLGATTALIDGEVVVEDARGVSSFSALQAALKAHARDPFVYYAFDLMHLDGRDLTGAPLVERKAALERLLGRAGKKGPIRYSEHLGEDGAVVHKRACAMSLEGIVSKRADAPYRSGRSDAFIKIKCANAQEFVVGGYVPSSAHPHAIGALAVGYYEGARFVYAGRMGTGYTRAIARDLWQRLQPLEVTSAPFDKMPATERRRDTHWVRPQLVIESEFRGWTADGLLRQAAFKGVREDKPAAEVVREMPVMDKSSKRRSPAKAAAHAARSASKRSSPARHRAARPASSAKPRREGGARLTHPDRVYWIDVGVTKQDLADYYRAVWDWMAPQVLGRPLALVRCPEGTKGQCFFQKHASAGISAQKLRTVIDKNGRQIIAVDDVEGLTSLVQAGVLEVHVRGSLIDSLERCDRIVFDLDPGEGLGWSDIVAAARDVHDRLAAIDLESFVKLSGGKGVHVVLPIAPTDWDETKTFVQAFAQAMAADHPDRYVAKMAKSIRAGKLFIDYLRNSLEQTSVAAYSTRARAGAPVSVPVSWAELGRTTGANQYTIRNVMQRLDGLAQDPWRDIGRVRQKLPDLQTLLKRG